MREEDAEKLIKELTGHNVYLGDTHMMPYLFEMISALNEKIKDLEVIVSGR